MGITLATAWLLLYLFWRMPLNTAPLTTRIGWNFSFSGDKKQSTYSALLQALPVGEAGESMSGAGGLLCPLLTDIWTSP